MFSLVEGEASKKRLSRNQKCELDYYTELSQKTLVPNPLAASLVHKYGADVITTPSNVYPWNELYDKNSMIYGLRDQGFLASDRFKDEATDVERAVFNRDNLAKAGKMAVEMGKLRNPPDLDSLLTMLHRVWGEEMPFAIQGPSLTPGVMSAGFVQEIADTITQKAVKRLVENMLLMRESYATYIVDKETHGIRGVYGIDRPVSTADGHIQELDWEARLPSQSWEQQLRDITGTRAPYTYQ